MTSPDHTSASDRLAEVMAHVNSTFTSICKVTNPNTVKVVLATKGDALHFSRAPIPYTRYGGNGGDVARYPKHVGQRSNAMVQNLTLGEQEITKIPVIHLRHRERSAAIHGCALRAMDRHGLRPRDDEGILVISTSLTWLASQINGSQNNAK